jgi:hypothetical protein
MSVSRHCEERKRRSNPFFLCGVTMGCFAHARNDGFKIGCLKVDSVFGRRLLSEPNEWLSPKMSGCQYRWVSAMGYSRGYAGLGSVQSNGSLRQLLGSRQPPQPWPVDGSQRNTGGRPSTTGRARFDPEGVTLSRLKQGFDSPRERQCFQWFMRQTPAHRFRFFNFSPTANFVGTGCFWEA